MYCCSEFNEQVARVSGIKQRANGSWFFWGITSYHVACSTDIKFCPFCGKNLRFIVQRTTGSILFDWKVTDKGKTVAHFDSLKAAQAYEILLQLR